jgi:hypothetical protein
VGDYFSFARATRRQASRAAPASISGRLFALTNYPKGKVFPLKIFDSLFPYGKVQQMAAQELDDLISELTSWCRAKHGRQRELAVLLGVSEQLVSNWLARRKTPTLQHGLQIQEILKKQRKSRSTDG